MIRTWCQPRNRILIEDKSESLDQIHFTYKNGYVITWGKWWEGMGVLLSGVGTTGVLLSGIGTTG